jgi:hypothetical protein
MDHIAQGCRVKSTIAKFLAPLQVVTVFDVILRKPHSAGPVHGQRARARSRTQSAQTLREANCGVFP